MGSDFTNLKIFPLSSAKKIPNPQKKSFVELLVRVGAESWAERVNSVGKLVVDVRKTRLRADMIDKLITLRMNTAFMEFMRLHCSKREKQVVVGLSESNVEASNEE